MATGEVFVGAILTVLLEMLASGELLKFLRRVGIDAQLEEWHTTLSMIQAVLTDAENKQTANVAVKLWLNDLEDLAYDLEDLVDELNTEALQRKLNENKGSTSKVRKLIPTCCTNLSYSDFMFDRGIASKLKEISGRLEALSKKIKILRLVESVRGRGRSYGRLSTTSLVVEPEVYGREKDREEILKILFGVESNDRQISVIPIVGMGGVGKTTLVQLVYNDERLKDKFDLKGWACVSDEFDAVRVTKNILESVSSGGKCDYDNFDTLQSKLKESLSNKKFLVVLDDIWHENYGDWDILRRPFLAGKPGSKIIITTRQERVAKIMSEIPAYNLNLLSEGDALSLLAQHAFGAKTFDGHSDLIEIGKSVVRRCKKLPLAVKSLGGLLRVADGPEEWEKVLKSEIWMDEERSEILPALKLSYHYLPPELKRCFAYCALFPKDYEFEKFPLVHFWMAEGLVQESKKDMLIEEVGSHYFDELLARSFFQQSRENTSRFVMHDLFNDLAMSVAGDKCLRMDDALQENRPGKISVKVRHLSFKRSWYETYPRFNFLDKVQKLRTFLPLSVGMGSNNFLSQRILIHLLPNLYCLRMLSLNGYSIYVLPDSIGDLRHLRYLGLAQNPLRWLPESVGTLINLQALILQGCRKLTKLPTSMENLINLRHLDISDTDELHEMPRGIAQLTSLRTLPKMTASKNNGMRLKDLGNLSFLQGEISIKELQNVVNVQEAMDARLMEKPSLNKIRLEWSKDFDDSRNKILDLDVLNALKPHKNLSTLEIMYYGGENFSNWIGDSAFLKLAEISFEFCKNCTTLPPLGQLPLLRVLSIRGIDQVKVISAEFYGNRGHGELPFQSLISLTFEDMSNWEEWLGIEGVLELPRLRNMNIRSCSKLVKLPDLLLPSLRDLRATKCNEVVLNHMQKLETLTQIFLYKIFGLTSIVKAFVQFPFPLESLEVDGCEDLVTIWSSDNIARNLVNLREVLVKRCSQLLSLQEIDALPGIRRLEIEECGALELLPNKISCLESLHIKRCPSLKTMMKLQDCSTSLNTLWTDSWENLNLTNLLSSGLNYLTKLSIVSCDGLESFPHAGLPTPNLKYLWIFNCQHLKSLPKRMDLLSSLSDLTVFNCTSLMELFPQENIPPNLSGLSVSKCASLMELFPQENIPPNLSSLLVCNCDSLIELFPQENIPPNLSNLSVSKCASLMELFPQENISPNLSSLFVWNCASLIELFPHENIPPNLSTLEVYCCASLMELFPQDNIPPNLSNLRVFNCASLMELFPQENIPPNLSSLYITYCEKLKPLGEWGLHKLTSLKHFEFGGCPELVSFTNNADEEHCVLPPSLTELRLENMPNLENLSKGFQNLASLQHLNIVNCPKLEALLMEDQLHKLLSLHICGCPLLKKRCLKNEGDYWPIIEDIPDVEIDRHSIYDPCP